MIILLKSWFFLYELLSGTCTADFMPLLIFCVNAVKFHLLHVDMAAQKCERFRISTSFHVEGSYHAGDVWGSWWNFSLCFCKIIIGLLYWLNIGLPHSVNYTVVHHCECFGCGCEMHRNFEGIMGRILGND